MPDNALYFPWIDPPKSSAIATAILYWDKLYTIVPSSIKRPYTARWSKAAHELGFLYPKVVTSNSKVVRVASQRYLNDVGRRAIEDDIEAVARRTGRHLAAHRLHPQKISWELRQQLWQTKSPSVDGFFRLADGHAPAYMSKLASTISEVDRLTPYTDRRLSRAVLVDDSIDYATRDHIGENEAALVAMSIEMLRMPSTTPIHDLWQFRQENEASLKRYRNAIRSLARQASSATTPEYRARELNRIFKFELQPAQEKLAQKLNRAGLDFGLSLLDICIGAAVGCATAGWKGALAVLGGGTIRIGISHVRWRIATYAHREDPLAYYSSLRQRFSPKES